ncbi:MAG TPA: hypothetical protein VF666_10350 [Pyrinomonadaceae bacterium]
MSLQIIEPIHDSNFVGKREVTMRGAVRSTGHGTLFFKWYSNLTPPPMPSKTSPDTSLNRTSVSPVGAKNPLDFKASLHTGSQSITFTARDVAGDDAEQLKEVRHAGMEGGAPPVPPLPNPPPNTPRPCVIHVLVAEMPKPLTGAVLSKANALLQAKVAPLWEDADYQKNINRLRFLWRFVPSGLPAGRETVLLPAVANLTPPVLKPPFSFDGEKSLLSYQGALPANLAAGSKYTLTLRVERKDNAAVGDEASVEVTINA